MQFFQGQDELNSVTDGVRIKAKVVMLCAVPLLSLIEANIVDPEVIWPNCSVVRRVGLLSVVQNDVHLLVGPLVCTVAE